MTHGTILTDPPQARASPPQALLDAFNLADLRSRAALGGQQEFRPEGGAGRAQLFRRKWPKNEPAAREGCGPVGGLAARVSEFD